MNNFLTDKNPYYKKAKSLIYRETWPKNKDELQDYEKRLEAIVGNCIEKAIEFTTPSLNVSKVDNEENHSFLGICDRF